MIKVENLIYDYPGFRALHSISCEVPAGTITALVGPNGAGKTTLMRCIAALTSPLSGTISVNGIDVISQPREGHRQIGYLSDFFGLYDRLTVYQSLHYFCLAQQMADAEIDSRIRKVIEQLHLSEKLQERIGSLSRGMRQRVGIAQAMIHNPQCLILDEPASGLDPEARYELGELFLQLNKEGITLLVSSHILAELDQYSNNLLIMRDGKIVDHDLLKQETKKSRRLRIQLLKPAEAVSHFLTSKTSVANILKEGNELHFDFAGNETEQISLLREMLQMNFEVAEFGEIKQNLQDQYIKLVKGTKSETPSAN